MIYKVINSLVLDIQCLSTNPTTSVIILLPMFPEFIPYLPTTAPSPSAIITGVLNLVVKVWSDKVFQKTKLKKITTEPSMTKKLKRIV